MGEGVCLLMCWLNSTSAYCAASTETQIKGKNSVNTRRQNTVGQKQYGQRKQYKNTG